MRYAPLSARDRAQALQLLTLLDQAGRTLSQRQFFSAIRKFPRADGTQFTKDLLVAAYRSLNPTEQKKLADDILERIKMKPTRTLSGVAPITVLTKPFPCPGKCIFCPNDIRMPKSYLADEPGAQRAERNYFDPYLQTYNRLLALHTIGHTIEKAEIIVLGGTWSFYPEEYQIWFISECFRALNDFGSFDDRERVTQHYDEMHRLLSDKKKNFISNDPIENKSKLREFEIDGAVFDRTYNHTVSQLYVAPEKLGGFDRYQTAEWSELEVQQKTNEKSGVRCVGLVIETRPDAISEKEVLRIRRLGCTKTQIGLQSLQDSVLKKNNRGHTVAASRKAVRLLRMAGLKIHVHWMANLYGSTVEKDKKDFEKLFSDPDFKPDELKIYPCSLIGSAELMQYHKKGLWHPYTHEQLLEVLEHAILATPPYCRLTRVIRDIPSTDIVIGNTHTNFRQIAERSLAAKHQRSQDIRAREVRSTEVRSDEVELDVVQYDTSVGTEQFLQFLTKEKKLAAFLRLSLPKKKSFIAEIQDSALIREVHVYGKVVGLKEKANGRSQHAGLGTRLIAEAAKRARAAGYRSLAVISAIGTREYYRSRGFTDGQLYQHMQLVSGSKA